MKYVFEEKSYTTLSDCYLDNKEKIVVGIATVRNRLKKGWSLEKSLLTPKEKTIDTRLGSHIIEMVEYPNLQSISEEYKIPLNTIYKRYSRGYRGDDLIPLKSRKFYVEPEIQEILKFYAGGVGYKSAADACDKLGVKYVTYRKRIESGLSVEQALNINPLSDGRSLRGVKYEIEGKTLGIRELSDLYSVSEVTIRDRLKRGATVRQAVNLDTIEEDSLLKQRDFKTKRKQQSIHLEVDGKVYTSYKTLADDYDLPTYTVRQRIVDYGYTAQDAVTANGKSQPITIEGKEYKSKADLAVAYGLTPAILLARLSDGRTIEEALGLTKRKTTRSVEYKKILYDSLSDLARSQGISAGALNQRINGGMSLEDAILAGSNIKNSGRYNNTILSRDESLSAKPAVLYFVSIIIEKMTRYKIGITTKSVNERLKQEGYDFKVMKVVTGTLRDCYILEQELIELLSDKRDVSITSDMLDGYSEIFILDSEDIAVITDLLS